MKHVIVALFAGSLALSPMYAFAADAAKDELKTGPAQGETKTEKAKDYVGKKAHNAKVKTKRAAKKTKSKVKSAVDNRKTTDPSSVSESKPDATK
jgi:polyhydroxyalkanoate synthesis regulator phasin